jgi:hypothetical protein
MKLEVAMYSDPVTAKFPLTLSKCRIELDPTIFDISLQYDTLYLVILVMYLYFIYLLIQSRNIFL